MKTILLRLGLLPMATRIRNGTWRYLRGGYIPRRFWEGWSERFQDSEFQREIRSGQTWLLGRLGKSPGVPILELGCGFGRNLGYLAENLESGRRFWGLDISAGILRRGREALSPQCRLVCGDLQALPFPDNGFELVFTHGVLMHVKPDALPLALAEIRRVSASTVFFVEETRWKGCPQGGSIKLNDYTYIHDYAAILPRHGFEIVAMGESGETVNLILLECRKA